MTVIKRESVLLLLIVWAISAALVVGHIDRGWVPHDEGLIGQTAERVLAGELPHRDFDDVYTGALAYVNAGAMRTFGMSVRSPRIVVAGLFLLCVPVLFYAATRFGSPLAAAVTTLVGVAWSFPNYIAALPSWYNLIFAVLGIAALLRFVEAGSRRWLFVAGLCGGASFLMKLVGLYFVAAGLLFLVYREQESESDTRADAVAIDPASGERSRAYSVFVIASLVVFVLALARVFHGVFGADSVLHYVVPGTAIAVALGQNERVASARRGPSRARFAMLARLTVPFLAGVVIPIAAFLIPYVVSGAVGDLVRGVLVLPARRLTYATMAPVSWRFAASTLGVVALLLVAKRLPRVHSLRLGALVAIGGAYLVLIASVSLSAYQSLFHAAALLPIATVLAAAVFLSGASTRPSARRQQLMIAAAGLGMFSLIQFPFAAPIYFCYVTPLLALGALAVTRELELASPAVPAALVATFLAFAVARMYPGFLYNLGFGYARYEPLAALPAPRGGEVRVPAEMAADYARLVDVVRHHAGSDSSYIYAAPDAPEVYFLTGYRNPTRTMYDFFDDAGSRTPRLLAALRDHDVKVVAINRDPEFSAKVSGALRAALEQEYPVVAAVGEFEVRWRE